MKNTTIKNNFVSISAISVLVTLIIIDFIALAKNPDMIIISSILKIFTIFAIIDGRGLYEEGTRITPKWAKITNIISLVAIYGYMATILLECFIHTRIFEYYTFIGAIPMIVLYTIFMNEIPKDISFRRFMNSNNEY